MKDDIRTSVDSKQKFSDDINQDTDLAQPPEEVIKSFAQIKENDLESQQGGFVVVPEKTERSGKKTSNPFKKLSGLSKKQKMIFGLIVLFIISGLGGGAYTMFKPKPQTPAPAVKTPVVQKKEEPPKPTTEASKLSGVQVPIGTNTKPVVSIQIENSPDARPQSGLNEASVVFEAIAEGGITRFNASFLDSQPEYIGPIRSVRPYYAQLAAPFDPIFVHAGGSADGLAMVRNLGLKDLDHGANGGAFQRVSDRYAPHNLYSSMSALRKAGDGRGFTTSDTKSFTRKTEKPGQTVTARAIDMRISSPLYNTHYDYDTTTNSYLRSLAGVPHKDQKSGVQITPKTVIALATPFSQNGIYSVYGIIGSGSCFIFQDGQVLAATWTKADSKQQIKFTDANGLEVPINPGQTWITLVKSATDVTFTP